MRCILILAILHFTFCVGKIDLEELLDMMAKFDSRPGAGEANNGYYEVSNDPGQESSSDPESRTQMLARKYSKETLKRSLEFIQHLRRMKSQSNFQPVANKPVI